MNTTNLWSAGAAIFRRPNDPGEYPFKVALVRALDVLSQDIVSPHRRYLQGLLARSLANRDFPVISGLGDHRQTRRKNERSYQTLLRLLDARAPEDTAWEWSLYCWVRYLLR